MKAVFVWGFFADFDLAVFFFGMRMRALYMRTADATSSRYAQPTHGFRVATFGCVPDGLQPGSAVSSFRLDAQVLEACHFTRIARPCV